MLSGLVKKRSYLAERGLLVKPGVDRLYQKRALNDDPPKPVNVGRYTA